MRGIEMDEYSYSEWLLALLAGTPLPGEYVPGTNPLEVITP
jgi:hypothetical protein